MKRVAFYISGHGYGHAVREAVLMNMLPQEWELFIVSSIPERFFQEELGRTFTYRYGRFDCGAIQKDAITVDILETLETYATLSKDNGENLEEEFRWIQEHCIDLICADVVPFASHIAKSSTIPAVGIGNFTWYDIYKPYVEAYPEYQWLLDELLEMYHGFTKWIPLTPTNELVSQLAPQQNREALFRVGHNRRGEIEEARYIPRDKKIVLLYVGNYGMDRVDWTQLASFDEYYFLSFYPLPIDSDNYQTISKERFSLQEFSASSDLIITKLGYGTVTESLSAGVPLLYIPREDFAEHSYLEEYIQSFGGVASISDEKFCRLDMSEELEKLVGEGRRESKIIPSTKSIVKEIASLLP